MESGYTGRGRLKEGEIMDADCSDYTTRREREQQRCREEILHAAAEMFSRFSYEKTSVQKIAERVELSVGKIYMHFDGKEAIFRELVERNFKIIESVVQHVIEQNDTPMQKIRDIIRIYVKHFERHRNFMLIVINENPVRMKGMIKKFHQEQKELVVSLFSKAIERGDILRQDPYVLTSVLLGSIRGLFTEYMDREGEDCFDCINEIVDRMILKPLEIRRDGASLVEEC